MITIYESQVQDRLEVCPYCMNPPTRGQLGCCGESSAHFEPAIDTGDEIYLESEVFIVPSLLPGSNPVVPLTVPLEEVKKALRVANSHDEDYSKAVLGYLVAHYSKIVPMAILTLSLFSCAPGMPIIQFGQPVPGPRGEIGTPGQDGAPGRDGQSCTVTQVANGALISCPDGTTTAILNGTNGVDGQPAPANAYDVVATIDPCGPTSAYDEILLKLANGQILAHFASGAKQFLTLVPPGNYTVTDGTGCKFTVTPTGEVTNEHN